MPSEGDINPQTLMVWGIVIASIFLIMMFEICHNIKVLHERRINMMLRVKSLLLGDMLKRIQLPLKSYFQLTTDMDVERHIRKCKNCAKPEECERMLLGEDIDPHKFCPNYTELEILKERLINQ